MNQRERDLTLVAARIALQQVLKALPPEYWQVAARNFVAGANIELERAGLPPTNLQQLLPAYSSDESAITFNAVMKSYEN